MNDGLFHRAAARLMWTISRRKWGLEAVLMPVIVRQLGPLGAVRWMSANIPKYERAVEDLGPIRANLVFAVASLLNGCAYCTFAHGRAFELHYFEQRGKLFPLDDQELISLIPLTDADVRGRLDAALIEAELESEIPILERLYALKLEGIEPNEADAHLVHAVAMYDFLNFCAIESQAALDDAHDRINKDEALKQRYAETRLAAGRKRLLVEELAEVNEQVLARADSSDGGSR